MNNQLLENIFGVDMNDERQIIALFIYITEKLTKFMEKYPDPDDIPPEEDDEVGLFVNAYLYLSEMYKDKLYVM